MDVFLGVIPILLAPAYTGKQMGLRSRRPVKPQDLREGLLQALAENAETLPALKERERAKGLSRCHVGG